MYPYHNDPLGGEPPEDSRSGALLDISNEIVRLYKEQFGRGPTHARTNWAGPNTLITTLENTLTRAERNLVAMGEHQRLRDTRMFFQYANVKEFCDPIERITGRRVRSFVSGIDTAVDGLSIELFILHPAGSDALSRSEHPQGTATRG
jgi:uncharacterized protein YbcI